MPALSVPVSHVNYDTAADRLSVTGLNASLSCTHVVVISWQLSAEGAATYQTPPQQ